MNARDQGQALPGLKYVGMGFSLSGKSLSNEDLLKIQLEIMDLKSDLYKMKQEEKNNLPPLDDELPYRHPAKVAIGINIPADVAMIGQAHTIPFLVAAFLLSMICMAIVLSLNRTRKSFEKRGISKKRRKDR